MLSRRPMLQNIRTGDRLAINLNTAEIGIVWRLNNSAALGIIPRSAAALFLCGVINVSVNPDVLPGWLLLGGGGAAGGVAFIWWAARRMDTARKAHRLFFRVVFTCYELPRYTWCPRQGFPFWRTRTFRNCVRVWNTHPVARPAPSGRRPQGCWHSPCL